MKNKIEELKEKYAIKKELTNDVTSSLELYEFNTYKISDNINLTISDLDYVQDVAQVTLINKKDNNKTTFYVDAFGYDRITSILNKKNAFYTQNLINGHSIEKEAFKNLSSRCNLSELLLIENYDELSIVEYVANNQFYIENNKIVAEV